MPEVRRRTLAVALVVALAAIGCGPSGNAKPSTEEIGVRIRAADANEDLSDAEVECLADAMRDELDTEALERILATEDLPIEELLATENRSALLARTFACFGQRIGG